ncbi:hypothetical protein FACS18949_18460 [Clostridia bacterium]|nr:hypothetical protein FACS18949_18460 [Clostridia bacterium]
MAHTYFNICDECKAHLDPGEICDCATRKHHEESKHVRTEDKKDGV